MSQLDQHLTTEQLSTLLDTTSFSATEAAEADQTDLTDLQHHLASCELCQQELAELRQTVALLRALPQPKLPRSFVLPASIQQNPAHLDADPLSSNRPISIHSRRQSKRSGTLRITLRAFSGLAAVAGILFVLSSLFNVIPFLSSTTNGITISNQSGIDPNGSLVTPNTVDTNEGQPNQSHTSRGDAQQPNIQQPATTVPPPQPTQSTKVAPSTHPSYQPVTQSSNPLVNIVSFILGPEWRMGIGILLFLLGACGLTYFKQHTKVPAGP